MSNNNTRFESYDSLAGVHPPSESCPSCEHYYTGACDGLRGWCKSYKQYRVKTLEELVKVSIGTNVMVGFLIIEILATLLLIIR